jgi:glycosyltransferase involved in cell wall biosynthesis
MPRISVVIPTIEEESLFGLVEKLRLALGRGIEIIIVDKSSNSYYERLKSTGATIIRQKDRGVESAIMQGLRRAKGDVLASIDADETHDISGVVEGVKLVESGKADFVLGNRMRGLESGSMDAYIRAGNSTLSWIFSRLYKTDVHDVMTGLFVMRRTAFDSIREVEPYRAGIAFFAIELARLGYRVREVNIKYYKRRHGKSKLTRSKLAYGVNVASHLIRQMRDYSPLLVFGGFGAVVALVGLGIGVGVIVNFLSSGSFTQTGRALLAFMLVVLGFLFFVVGLIIDMLLEIEKRMVKR